MKNAHIIAKLSRTLALCAAIAASAIASAQTPESGAASPKNDPNFTGVVTMQLGTQVDMPIVGAERILIGAPNMLDAELSDSSIRLTAKQPGTTILTIWQKDERNSYQVRVSADGTASGTTVRSQPKVLEPVELTLQPGESRVLNGINITRTSVSIPDVVNIVPVSPTEILLNAAKEGGATVRIWDDRGLATYVVTVAARNTAPTVTAETVSEQMGMPSVKVRMLGDTIVLDGVVTSAEMSKKATTIAEVCGKKVLNLIQVESTTADNVICSLKAALKGYPLNYDQLADQTVLITGTVPAEEDAFQISGVVQTWIGTPETDLNRTSVDTSVNFIGEIETPSDVSDKTATEAHALLDRSGSAVVREEFNIARHVFGGRIPNGPRILATIDVNPALTRQILVHAQVIEVDRSKLKRLGIQWAEILGAIPVDPLTIIEDRPSPVPLGEAGPFRRSTLTATVKALITEDAARILSEPKLLITDGHPANILVGGELPIPVAQNVSVGSTAISVLFKPFGIQLTVRPRITPDNQILLTLTPEVSDLDFTNAVVSAGIRIPALTVRRATTTVYVSNGEALAIGGLLSSKDTKIIDRVPLLSKIPIIGELFKSRDFRKDLTELIIIVTPQIVERNGTVPIAMPQ